jgi:hypothetical protein
MSQFHIRMNYFVAIQNHVGKKNSPCFGANKEDLLHVTHCIISLSPFGNKYLFLTQYDINI